LNSISIQSGKILNLPVIHKVVFNMTLSSFSNRLKFPLALLLFTFGQAACVSIEVEVPGPLMSAPELSSKKGDTQFTFGTEQSTRYTFTDDASRRPLDLTTSSSSRAGGYLFGNAGYSVTEWFQLSLGLIPTSLGTPLNVGTQILGHLQVIGHGTEAGAKLAIFGGYLSTSVSTGGNQNGTFGPGGHDWRARAWAQSLTIGGSAGYRFSVGPLFYIAGGYADQMLAGTIEHARSDDGLSAAADYSIPTIKGTTTSVGLGLLFGVNPQMSLQARQFYRNWPGTTLLGGGESTDHLYTFQLRFN